MAENKKSFVLYADLVKSIEHLTNEEKGVLFNHLLLYVNDQNPVLEDRLVLTAWKPIELQLKRDLRKFEEVKAKRSDAGKRSAELRALKADEQTSTNSTSVESVQQMSTNPTDNVTVNVNDTVIYKYNEETFLENWAKCRNHYLKQPTNIKQMNFIERASFKQACTNYTKEEINDAMITLFTQKEMLNESMWLRPQHFLDKIDVYYSGKNNCNIWKK